MTASGSMPVSLPPPTEGREEELHTGREVIVDPFRYFVRLRLRRAKYPGQSVPSKPGPQVEMLSISNIGLNESA